MEGKLYYAFGLQTLEDDTLYWLSYERDRLIAKDCTGICKYTDLLSAESFMESIIKMTLPAEAGSMLSISEDLTRKMRLLGSYSKQENGRVEISFQELRIQIYKVMINSCDYVVVKEPASDKEILSMYPQSQPADLLKQETTMTDAERAASDAAWDRSERDREARGAMM